MDTLQEILGQEIPPATSSIIRPPSPRIVLPGERSEREASRDELATKIAKNMEAYFLNPWAMVEDGVIWTLDQTDMIYPIKRFPNHPWLEAVTNIWLQEPLFAMYKSRRMTITWLMVFLHTWLAMFREGASIYFVSDKEEKSDELVQRAAFILDHIPDDMVLKPRYKYTYCYIDFPGLNTFIQGVPQGPDQLRQFTATAILCDEWAFWERARETFGGAKPTIDGGGRFTGISSPKDGFFKELCFDLIR